jgi:hypothetical protein
MGLQLFEFSTDPVIRLIVWYVGVWALATQSNPASKKTPFIALSPATSPAHHPTLSAAVDGELR